MTDLDERIKYLEKKVEELDDKNKKLLESQVKMGEVTNNYLMLHYLNKNIHECRTSQILWETYLHNITDYGFNYDSVYILLPQDDSSMDDNCFNTKLHLINNQLVIEKFPQESLSEHILNSIKTKSSVSSLENLEVSIPIINVTGYIKGLLIVKKEFGISFEDIELLEIYTQQTVSTIENILLNEKLMDNQNLLGEKINQFIMLHYVTKEIHDSKRYYQVLEKYLRATTSELGFNFKNSTLYTIEDEINKVYLKDDKLFFEKITLFDKTYINEAYESMTYCLSEDSFSLAIPLLSHNKVNAIIDIVDDKEISNESIQLLEIFAMQTSTMLVNTKLTFNLQHEVDKQTAELQKAYEELKKLDGLKNEFLAMVSHELRTPLTSIIAYLETILESFNEDDMLDKETEQDFINIIYTESNRLKIIVDDVLDLSKLEAGKMIFNYENISVNSLLTRSISNFSMQAQNKNIHFIQNLTDNISYISADSTRLLQVISNILSNAIKFTPDNKSIYVSSYEQDDFVYFKIQDTGIGINKEDFPKVFSKFEQIENIEHHSKGTGLGMPISKMLIEKQNGEIWFESVFGEGTTFFVKFPKV